jgi:hypothetical protein
MIRSAQAALILLAALSILAGGTVASRAGVTAKGLGDPGRLEFLSVDQAESGQPILLRGPDSRRQLCVTGHFSSGQFRDLSRAVRYTVVPSGIIDVDSTGLVTPRGDGLARVRISGPQALSTECTIRVERFANPVPINFKNQIVPIFTKLGCNSGGCHGKASGQNGFKLSLLGFDPEDDYEFLVKEGRGRRLFPASPGQSLILMKPTGRYPHGGGKRMEP